VKVVFTGGKTLPDKHLKLKMNL